MTSTRKAASIVAVVGVVVCALSGFGGEWLYGELSGWMLTVHMAAAPLVMAGFAAIAVLWGRRHRFDVELPAAGLLAKLLFWLMLSCALVSATTILIAMLPLFGYVGQDWLTVLHERSGLGVVLTGAVYLPLMFVARNKRAKQNA